MKKIILQFISFIGITSTLLSPSVVWGQVISQTKSKVIKGSETKTQCIPIDDAVKKAEKDAKDLRKKANEAQAKAERAKSNLDKAEAAKQKGGSILAFNAAQKAYDSARKDAYAKNYAAAKEEKKANNLKSKADSISDPGKKIEEAEDEAKIACSNKFIEEATADCKAKNSSKANRAAQEQAEADAQSGCAADHIASCEIVAEGSNEIKGDCKKGFECSGQASCVFMCTCVPNPFAGLENGPQSLKQPQKRAAPAQVGADRKRARFDNGATVLFTKALPEGYEIYSVNGGFEIRNIATGEVVKTGSVQGTPPTEKVQTLNRAVEAVRDLGSRAAEGVRSAVSGVLGF